MATASGTAPDRVHRRSWKRLPVIKQLHQSVGLQRGMSSLVKDMSENFENVFAASEDIKKLMQGVYNTFIEKFAFQKMKVPALDLDPQRTKLQLLVMQTEQFVKDPVNGPRSPKKRIPPHQNQPSPRGHQLASSQSSRSRAAQAGLGCR